MKSVTKTLFWLAIFSIAMAFMESAVVVYLRELYYPDGFDFPLVPLDTHVGLTEILREVATMIMLAGIGILVGKNKLQKFAFFIFCFGIWDIFYYVFLKLLLGWPVSIFTWDILFLIPVPWTGPVISPVIISLNMIGLALLIVFFQNHEKKVLILKKEWTILLFGSLLVLGSFMWDYFKYAQKDLGEGAFTHLLEYVPDQFNWPLFLIGEGLILIGIIGFAFRNLKSPDPPLKTT